MLKISTPAEALARHPLFAGLDESPLLMIASQAQRMVFPKGQVIFSQGDVAAHIYLILDGWVKLYRDTLDGQEYIVDVLPEGYVFGEHALFLDGRQDYAAEAVENLTLLRISLPLLHHLLAEHPAFGRQMLSHFAHQQAHARGELEHLAVQTAAQRVGCFLLRLCPSDVQATGVLLRLPYDKTLLASRLGMQRETFSRALASLQKEALISVDGAQVSVASVGELSSYCCGACSNSFPCADRKMV